MKKVLLALVAVVLGAAAYLYFGVINNKGTVNTDQAVENTDQLKQASQEEIDALVEAFIMAEDSSTITIPEGFFELETQLILDQAKHITVKGAGMEKSVLSFANLKSGGEGVRASGCNYITFEDFSVFDSPGDCIKTMNCTNVVFRRLNTTWTGGKKSENGIYAIYPVQCQGVLIEECVASHSRDAGIYVGQSRDIVVRNNHAFGNVAGIEIENSYNAEVYGNLAEENTGGVLVFNLPGLPQAWGSGTRIYDNDILNNNHENFAQAISESNNGNAVTKIPPGSGVILLAAEDVEVSNNRIHGNKTIGIGVANYQITGFPYEDIADTTDWSPFTSNILITGNTFKRPATPPDMSMELGQLISVKNAYGPGKSQDIIYDGFLDPAKGSDISTNPMNICIDEEEIEDLHFSYYDLYTYGETGKDGDIESFKDYTPFTNCNISVQTDVTEVEKL